MLLICFKGSNDEHDGYGQRDRDSAGNSCSGDPRSFRESVGRPPENHRVFAFSPTGTNPCHLTMTFFCLDFTLICLDSKLKPSIRDYSRLFLDVYLALEDSGFAENLRFLGILP